MEILPGVHLVDNVVLPGPGGPNPVNVGLLVDGGAVTLVDAGPPGAARTILDYVQTIGPVRRIIVTHHHVDHTGGLAELVELTGAEVWAHGADAGLIDGSVPREIVEMPEERIRAFLPAATAEEMAALRARMREFMQARPARVDLRLAGGEELAVLGGVRILHTPGHTPGHLCLYLPDRSLLIGGDLLRYEEGRIAGPPPGFTEDPARAAASVAQVAGLAFEHLYGYHGAYLPDRADRLVRAL